MAKSRLKQGVEKFRHLRPGQVRKAAERPFKMALRGASATDTERLAAVFAPPALETRQRERALAHFAEPGEPTPEIAVITPLAAAGLHPAASRMPPVIMDPAAPGPGIAALLRQHPEYRLALARAFPGLRDPIARELIRAVALRNAALAALSAIPEVIPSPASLIFALGEMGSDTILLTANQIGLGFELAAARGAEVGWSAQSRAILGIMAGALGWRSLARELVSLIPAGVGLGAKAAIAYSGTLAVGATLWRLQPRSASEQTLPLARQRQRA